MGKASKAQALTIHRYQDRPCEIPHETWSGDYAAVKKLSAREVQVFFNSHTFDYLTLFCEHTPVMETFLETSDHRGRNYRALTAITQHFHRAQWEGGEE